MPFSSCESGSTQGDVTLLLGQMLQGKAEARDELVTLLYPDMKRLAEFRMNHERRDHTLQPTALVSEFFLAMCRVKGVEWRNRAHFLAVASRMMRRYLIDYARSHNAERRGSGQANIQIECLELGERPFDILEIADLMERLAAEDPRMAEVVDMRCFGGLTHAEIAEALHMDERTSKRDWQTARAWLAAQLEKKAATP